MLIFMVLGYNYTIVMRRNQVTGIGFMEGRAYTIGRDGHIKLDDPSASRGHAEIRFVDGRIQLRDLDSTNGTYLIFPDKIENVHEVYVTPNQRLMIGSRLYSVKSLLAHVGIFASWSEQTGLSIKLAAPKRNLHRREPLGVCND